MLCLCVSAHFYSICSLFSYGAIMCVDLGWADDADSAGFVAGYLQSANTLARIPTASLWGMLADRLSRRAALLLTMSFITCGGVAFGLVSSLWAALFVRAVFFGLCNGWVTLLATLAMDIGGATRQMEVLGKVLGTSLFIQLFGPSVGGWTYGAVKNYPGLLPSIGTTVFGCTAVVACWWWLPAGSSDNSDPAAEAAGKVGGPKAPLLICAFPVPLLIGLRSINGFAEWALFDLVPLWAISSQELGGLALSQTELGFMLSGAGLCGVGFTFCMLPPLTRRLGLQRASLLAAASSATACVVFSVAAPSLPSAVALQIVTLCAKQVTIPSLIALTNNAAPSCYRGTLNGIVVAFEGISKGAAPAIIATLFAWTLSRWGRHGHAVAFVLVGALYVVLALGICKLPNDLEFANEEPAPSPVLPSATKPTIGATIGATSDIKDQELERASLVLSTAEASISPNNEVAGRNMEMLEIGPLVYEPGVDGGKRM